MINLGFPEKVYLFLATDLLNRNRYTAEFFNTQYTNAALVSLIYRMYRF